jgi:hypothetical protein
MSMIPAAITTTTVKKIVATDLLLRIDDPAPDPCHHVFTFYRATGESYTTARVNSRRLLHAPSIQAMDYLSCVFTPVQPLPRQGMALWIIHMHALRVYMY